MPLFTDPDAPSGPEAVLLRLKESGGLLLGLMGWATVALGLAEAQAPLWPTLAGLLAVVLARRAYATTFVIEGAAFALALTLLTGVALDWALVGGALCATGRALSLSWRS